MYIYLYLLIILMKVPLHDFCNATAEGANIICFNSTLSAWI